MLQSILGAIGEVWAGPNGQETKEGMVNSTGEIGDWRRET